MDSRAALHLSHDSFGHDAMAFDCGGDTLVVGRTPLFVRMQGCTSEVRRGDELEDMLRRELDATRNRHLLAKLYRLVGPDMSFAHTPYLTDLMLRHIAHAGGIRAYRFETLPAGPTEPPEGVRDLILSETPSGGGVEAMSQEERFHRVLLTATADMKPTVADEWQRLVARDGLAIPVGSLGVMSGAFNIPGAGVSMLLTVGFATAGFRIFASIGHWTETFKITRQATRQEDLERAAFEVAMALNAQGPDTFLAFATRGAVKVTAMLRAAPHRSSEGLDPVTGLLRS